MENTDIQMAAISQVRYNTTTLVSGEQVTTAVIRPVLAIMKIFIQLWYTQRKISKSNEIIKIKMK